MYDKLTLSTESQPRVQITPLAEILMLLLPKLRFTMKSPFQQNQKFANFQKSFATIFLERKIQEVTSIDGSQ